MIPRLISSTVFSDSLGRQMRFIAGPRQSGKTTLAKMFLREVGDEAFYYNWDTHPVIEKFRENPAFLKEDLFTLPKDEKKKLKHWVCFDEIHKMPQWKNILKGQFDTLEDQIQFIITGSARLDMFRRSGDSLAGRYFMFRLLPFNLFELTRFSSDILSFLPDPVQFIESRVSSVRKKSKSVFKNLFDLNGFPEPFLNGEEKFITLWRRNYEDRLVRGDLRDLTRIEELENISRLIQLLPGRIASPLSVNSLAEDLSKSFDAVSNYLRALKLCFFLFEVPVYSKKISRSIKKEKKIYFYDWSLITDLGSRFENYIACELLSWLSFWHDSGLGDFELKYLRTRDGREIDFVLVKDAVPWLLIEAKMKTEPVGVHVFHYQKLLGDIPFIQLVCEENILKVCENKQFIISASRFLSA
ncbi:MAG: ATP-binding protein [Candidatus Omnitrophica bacterium]|nr:ATP-binding protein [Candidatus Omnitrophota bacterium]